MKRYGEEERRLEWRVARIMLMCAAVMVASAVAMVASVFFGWGAVA